MQELMEQVCNLSLGKIYLMPIIGRWRVQVQIEYLPVDAKENGQHFKPGCGACFDKEIMNFFHMVS